jgi:hypothetical protein
MELPTCGFSIQLGARHMTKNFVRCPHCKSTAVSLRLNEKTPIVNRTDEKTFHVALFSGPYRGHWKNGDLINDRMLCSFVCTYSGSGAGVQNAMVAINHAKQDDAGSLAQIEEVADELAEVVKTGSKLSRTYTYENQKLRPGPQK